MHLHCSTSPNTTPSPQHTSVLAPLPSSSITLEALPRALAEWAYTPPAGYCGAGLGFMLTADDNYLLVDLDHSISPETGLIQPWAQDIITTLSSYTQRSVSRQGLHTLVKGIVPQGGKQHGDLQMWDHDRLCAMTGWHLPETPSTIEARQSQLTMVHAAYILKPKAEEKAAKQHAKRTQRSTPSGTPRLSNDKILTKARAAKNSPLFSRLWSGDWSGYRSQSEADEALCCLLAFWT